MEREKVITLKAECIACGKTNNQIRIETWKLKDIGLRRIAFVACDACYVDKRAIEQKIIELKLYEQRLPSGIKKEHIELSL